MKSKLILIVFMTLLTSAYAFSGVRADISGGYKVLSGEISYVDESTTWSLSVGNSHGIYFSTANFGKFNNAPLFDNAGFRFERFWGIGYMENIHLPVVKTGASASYYWKMLDIGLKAYHLNYYDEQFKSIFNISIFIALEIPLSRQ